MYNNINYLDESELELSTNSKIIGLTDKMSLNNKKNSLISLKEYIDNRRVAFGDKSLTHQWWDNEENINFKISDEEYHDFLQVYGKELKKQGKILHVMEQPREIGPLCLDFDFKLISPERRIFIDDIAKIVGIVNNIVHKFYSLKDNQILDSYVFMKKEPFFIKKKQIYSDGFHLQYPNLILNFIDRFLIYQESRKEIIKQDLFLNVYPVMVKVNNLKNNDNQLDSDNISDSESENEKKHDKKNNYYLLDNKEKEKINDEIFDPSVILKNKWFMYGSGKNIDNEINIYLLKYIFNYNVEEIFNSDDDEGDKPKTKELVKILSIRKLIKQNDIIEPKLTNEYNDIIESVKLKYCKKQFASNFDISKLFKPCEDNKDNKDNQYELTNLNQDSQDTIEITTNNKLSKLANQNQNNSNNKDNIQFAKKLIKLLNKSRAYDYNEWIPVGWSLYNVSPTLLPEFIEFSKLAGKKFDQNSCLKVWDDCSNRYEKSGYSLPSLISWVKEDNNDGYKQILKEKINSMLDKGDIRTEFDVACILKEIYKYEYKCSSISKSIWWKFENHRWNRIDCAYSFSISLSTEVAAEFANLHSDIMKLAAQEISFKADSLRKRCKGIENLIFSLKKGSFKDSVIKQCSLLFYEKDFESKLDQNNYLIGFTNGVYDLANRVFRKGCPEDMIGKTIGYAYNNKLTKNDQIIKEIEEFIKSIQPEPDMRKYLMVYCASFLEGSNKDQKFMIWTGSGSNGKGSLIDLLDNTFNGNSEGYFGTLPPTVLTQKRGSSSAATPELADKFGKRVITLQEPEGDDKIHVGFMKNITGQDKIEARPLYGDPFQYTPQFKLLLACNHLPNIPSDDGGTWRRIRVIDFAIKFTSNPNPQNSKEIKADPKLRDKMKKWNTAFIWLLINEYYPLYVENEGLDNLEPDSVKEATNKYKTDSNAIMEFFNEILEKDTSCSLLLNEVYDMFKGWYTNSYNDKKPLQRKKFKEYFDNNNFKIESSNRGIIINGVREKNPSNGDIHDSDNEL